MDWTVLHLVIEHDVPGPPVPTRLEPLLTRAPLQPADLTECEPLWPDRLAFSGSERRVFFAEVSALLRTRRARGTVVREGGRAYAVGVSVFVCSEWAIRHLSQPAPLLSKQLLSIAAHPAVLTEGGIARGNSGSGLTLVVLGRGQARTSEAGDWTPQLFGALLESFLEHHRGFNISQIVYEVVGDANVAALDSTGLFTTALRFETAMRDKTMMRSAQFVLTKEEAFAKYSPLLPVFMYEPPQIHFTSSEQELLAAALSGAPDTLLASELGASVAAIKARWTRIYQRAAAIVPQPVDTVSRASATSRGAQVRHLIVDYIRRHPSELTPHLR